MSTAAMEQDIVTENSIQHEESKLYACFALQSNIFVNQVNELIALNKVLCTHEKDINAVNESIPVPDILKKRLGGDKLDDFEVLLLCKFSTLPFYFSPVCSLINFSFRRYA